jgi:hypothetical protein
MEAPAAYETQETGLTGNSREGKESEEQRLAQVGLAIVELSAPIDAVGDAAVEVWLEAREVVPNNAELVSEAAVLIDFEVVAEREGPTVVGETSGPTTAEVTGWGIKEVVEVIETREFVVEEARGERVEVVSKLNRAARRE